MTPCSVCSFANASDNVLCEICQSPLNDISPVGVIETDLKACPMCTALNPQTQVICTVCESAFPIIAMTNNINKDSDNSSVDELLFSVGQSCPRCTVVIQPQSIAQKSCDCCGHSLIAEKNANGGKRKKGGGRNSNNSRASRETQAIQCATASNRNDANEIHFGSTQSTTGLIELLDDNLKKNVYANNNRYRLVSPCTHLTQANAEGSTWACGYRNLQMLILSLMKVPAYRLRLFNGDGDLPDIHGIQAWIEKAWSFGFDQQGSMDFQGQLLGKSEWIGAAEGAALLRFFGIRCHVVEIADRKFYETIMAGKGIHSIARYNCDGCSSQIQNIRFRCTVRPDFDLCSACYNKFPQEFPMKEIPIEKSPYVKESHPATSSVIGGSSSSGGVNPSTNGTLNSSQLLNNFVDSRQTTENTVTARVRVNEDEENMKLAIEASLHEYDEDQDENAFGDAGESDEENDNEVIDLDSDSECEKQKEKEEAAYIGEKKTVVVLDDDVVCIDVDKSPPRKRAASDGSDNGKIDMGDDSSINNAKISPSSVQQPQQSGKNGKSNPRAKKQTYAENAERLEDWLRRYFDAFSKKPPGYSDKSKDIRSFMENGSSSSSSNESRGKGQSNSLRNLTGTMAAASTVAGTEPCLSEAELQSAEMQSLVSEYGLDHTISPFVHPVFLQHQGHSRTIVGFEETSKPQHKMSVLLFDPAFKGWDVKDKLSKALESNTDRGKGKGKGKGGKKKGGGNKKDTNWQQLVKRQLSTFNKGVYQLLFVNGIMSEKEREDSKIVQVKKYDEELDTLIRSLGK